MSTAPIKEKDSVRTVTDERATVYMIHPNGRDCVLLMTDQFMRDGGAAFRTVELSSITKDRGA